MSKLVFKLSNVSKEEANGVRNALESSGVEFYETPGGSWGWSLPGIWVKHDNDYDLARQAIDQYQQDYVKEVRSSTPTDKRYQFWKIGLVFVMSLIILFIFNYFWLSQW